MTTAGGPGVCDHHSPYEPCLTHIKKSKMVFLPTWASVGGVLAGDSNLWASLWHRQTIVLLSLVSGFPCRFDVRLHAATGL